MTFSGVPKWIGIDHTILLEKMDCHFGIRGLHLQLHKSY